jgi:hypothetical protein
MVFGMAAESKGAETPKNQEQKKFRHDPGGILASGHWTC